MLLKEEWSISMGNLYLYIRQFSSFTVGVSLIYLGNQHRMDDSGS